MDHFAEIQALKKLLAGEQKSRQEAESALQHKDSELLVIQQEVIRLRQCANHKSNERAEEFKQLNDQLPVALNGLKLITQHLQFAVMVEEENGKIFLINQKFCDLFRIPY